MKDKVKPCPFCGQMPERLVLDLSDRKRYLYQCTNDRCLVQPATIGHRNTAHALQSWNRRDGEDD